MPSYCSLADLKSYLNIATTTDDTILQIFLDAATNRINSKCGRVFQAAADSVRYFDPTIDIIGGSLWLDDDLSHITSVVNGDDVDITSYVFHQPRNKTPYYALGILSSQAYYWTYRTDVQNAIAITGRWAYMEKATITALSRATNVVTATVFAPHVSVGASVFVVGCADTSFNGTFTVTANNGASITWAQSAANDTDTTAYILFTPTDIVAACRRMAAWLYRQKDTQQGDQDRPILAGDGSVIMPSTLPQDIEMLLRPYIRRL